MSACLPACLRGRRGLEAVGRAACVVAPFWNPPAALQPASWHRVVPALHRLLTCDLPLPTASPPHPRCMPSPPCGALPPLSADVSPCLHCPTAIPTFPCGAFPRVLGQKKTTTVLVIHASARASPAPSSFQPLLPTFRPCTTLAVQAARGTCACKRPARNRWTSTRKFDATTTRDELLLVRFHTNASVASLVLAPTAAPLPQQHERPRRSVRSSVVGPADDREGRPTRRRSNRPSRGHT